MANKQILWVEDDNVITGVLTEKVKDSGLELKRAKNSEEALLMLKMMTPDAIVVDLLLPGGMDGFQFLQKISSEPRLRPIPKMVLSNLSKSADWDRVRAFGARKFIVKSSATLEQIASEIKELVSMPVIQPNEPSAA